MAHNDEFTATLEELSQKQIEDVNLTLAHLNVKHSFDDYLQRIQNDITLDENARKNRVALFKKQMLELDEVYQMARGLKGFNRQQIINWHRTFQDPSLLDEHINSALAMAGQKINCYKGYTNLALNFISLALILFGVHSEFAHLPERGSNTSSSESCLGALSNFIAGAQHAINGDSALSTAHIFSGIHKLTTVITLNVAKSAITEIGKNALVSFSGAAILIGLALAIGVEFLQIHRSKDRIKCITKRMTSCSSRGDCENLNQLLILEHATLERHQQKTNTLIATAVVMTVVTILLLTVLSGTSFGAVPAAMVMFAAAKLLTSLIQHLWNKSHDTNKKLKTSANTKAAQPIEATTAGHKEENHLDDDGLLNEASIIDAWNTLVLGLLSDADNQGVFVFPITGIQVNLLEPVSFKQGLFSSEKMTLKTYIDKLFSTVPDKAEAVVNSLITKDFNRFEDSLAIHGNTISKNNSPNSRRCFRTHGTRLLERLRIDPANDGPMLVAGH